LAPTRYKHILTACPKADIGMRFVTQIHGLNCYLSSPTA
jgi:hypothetical protein